MQTPTHTLPINVALQNTSNNTAMNFAAIPPITVGVVSDISVFDQIGYCLQSAINDNNITHCGNVTGTIPIEHAVWNVFQVRISKTSNNNNVYIRVYEQHHNTPQAASVFPSQTAPGRVHSAACTRATSTHSHMAYSQQLLDLIHSHLLLLSQHSSMGC